MLFDFVSVLILFFPFINKNRIYFHFHCSGSFCLDCPILHGALGHQKEAAKESGRYRKQAFYVNETGLMCEWTFVSPS